MKLSLTTLTLSFRVLLVLALVVMTYLMLSKPTPGVHGLLNDKLAHGLGFFALAFLAELAFPQVRYLWKALALVSYGMLIELIQQQLGYRFFSWLDWFADIAGVLAFYPLIQPVNNRIQSITG